MRSLQKSNKMSFIILGVFISFILGLLVLFIVNYTKNKSVEYKIVSGSVVYDKDNVFIKTTAEGNLRQGWTDDYYLNVGQEEYNLGKQSVIYNSNTGSLSVYGKIYKILDDASVAAESAATEVDISNIPVNFYKLADRKYLVTGDNIKINEENLVAEKYLIVDIDKSGNCQIFNDKINLKMLKQINIAVGNYTFNVAKEELDINGELVSLAKIGGSTNEFASLDESNINKEEQIDSNNNNSNSNNNNNNSVGNSISNGGQGSLIGGNSGQQLIIGGGSTNSGGSTSNTETTVKPKESRLKINYVESKPNSLRVNYSIIDYENKFSSVFLIVEDSSQNKQKIILNSSENIKSITGLSPDSSYTIYIGATISKITNGVEENIETIMDEFKTRTSEINSQLVLEKFSSKEIKFNFKVDSDFKLTSVNATLYVDDVAKEKIPVDVDKASTSAGWSSVFNIEDYVDEAKKFTIKLEEAVYNDVTINITNEINVANGFIKNIIRSFEKLYRRLF